MERKIGEIFEYNGEWYQCVEGTCRNCSFYDAVCENIITIGNCYYSSRTDHKFVIFKKLEKVGETYEKRISDDTFSIFQRYKACNPVILSKKPYMYYNFIDSTIEIEIKQTKEDMEEKKLNLKPFDIQKAREGKPVCTRDGAKARIICFDAKSDAPIIALITTDDGTEIAFDYLSDGTFFNNENPDNDLMMLPEKHEGWVNVYRDCDGVNITKDDNIYSSREAAIASAQFIDRDNYVATTIINWEA